MSEWISVKDRLPNRKDKVLVFDQYGNIDVSMFGWTSFDDFDSIETQVTHWMPLPEPPREIKHTYSEIGTATGFRWLKADGSVGHLKAGETMPMPLPEPPK